MFHAWIPAARGKVNLACNSSADVEAKGTVRLPISDGQITRSVQLENTLFVPDLRVNLMSVAKITDKCHEVIFKQKEAIIRDANGQVRMVADRSGDLYFTRKSTESVIQPRSERIKPRAIFSYGTRKWVI